MLAKLSPSLLLLAAFSISLNIASSSIAQQVGVVCPKCGKIHGSATSSVVQASATIPQASYSVNSSTPMPSASIAMPKNRSQGASSQGASSQGASSQGVSNVLSTLNAQRARQGIGQLGYDSELQAVAERRAAEMARSGLKSHPPGSYSPGRYEGVGWSSSYSPSGVSACFTSDSRMRVAGAAMATGRDGVYFAVVYR